MPGSFPRSVLPSQDDWKPPPAVMELPKLPLFRLHPSEPTLPYLERVSLSLRRAQAIVRAYNLNADDVALLRPSFWAIHSDPIMTLDYGAANIISIHVNIIAGTLTTYLDEQPSLGPLIQSLLKFDVLGHFLLTEVGHGLDIINLETEARVDAVGGFILNTPSPNAAKIMAPTSPLGIPAIGIVFAKLLVDGKSLGIKPFVVPINDGKQMTQGVTCQLLPPRGGAPPLNHSITSFKNVRLSPEALLGKTKPLPRGQDRLDLLGSIFRVAIGSLALSCTALAGFERCAYIAAKYSLHRTTGTHGEERAIISFRTQHHPILVAFAQVAVYSELKKVAVNVMQNLNEDPRVRHAYATTFKATVLHAALSSMLDLSERCGFRGLFEVNAISVSHASFQGLAIAEGDNLVLCVRLTSELLIGRYTLPKSSNPDSRLAKHERGVFEHAKQLLQSSTSHRGKHFDHYILPMCQSMIRAIGHRMAYDAAVDAHLDSRLIDLYVASVVNLDPGWYVQYDNYSIEAQRAFESEAVSSAYPLLEEWLSRSRIKGYVEDVPIVSSQNWDAFVADLPKYETDLKARL